MGPSRGSQEIPLYIRSTASCCCGGGAMPRLAPWEPPPRSSGARHSGHLRRETWVAVTQKAKSSLVEPQAGY